MTEQEWLNCTNPKQMLEFLMGKTYGNYNIIPKLKVSERKLRLFVVACCYRVWEQLDDDLSRQAIIVLERYADGLATIIDLRAAMSRAAKKPWRWVKAAWAASETESGDFLRDIYNQRLSDLDPAVLNWNDSTVVKLARAIYDDKAFDQMPVLADALEESGCTDPTILAHLRSPNPHIRGCWALDTILGKN